MPFRPWRPQAHHSSDTDARPHPRPTSSTSSTSTLHPPHRPLTDTQRRAYKLEKGDNFRWAARLLASPSTRVLTRADLVPPDLERSIVEVGQFAEVVHGSIDPSFVWRNLGQLLQPTFPLEGYTALAGSSLVSVFHGEVTKLQGYIAYRPAARQLVVAFSGTSSLSHALHDLDSVMVPYPTNEKIDIDTDTGAGKGTCKVHRGFWRIHNDLKNVVLDKCAEALRALDVAELVITGHSLGATQASLFLLELLQQNPDSEQRPDVKDTRLPLGVRIKVFGFGSPRIGNEALAHYFCKLVSQYQEKRGKASLQEYLIKGYNDGVPSLPPKALGFRQATSAVLYSACGRLYHIPFSEREHSVFPVHLEDESRPLDFPLGGHNYYCNRDMEKMQRGIVCLKVPTLGEAGWEERYKRYWNKVSQNISL